MDPAVGHYGAGGGLVIVLRSSLAALLFVAGCTTYVDAILPPADSGAPMDSNAQEPQLEIDETFGESGLFTLAASTDDHVTDACLVPDGTLYVLLREACTVVAVTAQGTLYTTFAKGGVLRGDAICQGTKLSCDLPTKRIFVVEKTDPISVLSAYNLDGSPSLTLKDGNKAKVNFTTIGSLLSTPTALLIAGSAPSMTGITIEAIGLKGESLNRQHLETGVLSRGMLLYQTPNAEIFVLADLPGTGVSLTANLLTAPTTELARMGSARITNTLDTTPMGLDALKAAKLGPNDQPIILGEGWEKQNPLVRVPFVWGGTSMAFGEVGAAILPQGMFTTYADVASQGELVAAVGTEGLPGQPRPVAAVLNFRGKPSPDVGIPALFALPLPEVGTAVKVLFTNEKEILVVGNQGLEGSGSVFVTRLTLN